MKNHSRNVPFSVRLMMIFGNAQGRSGWTLLWCVLILGGLFAGASHGVMGVFEWFMTAFVTFLLGACIWLISSGFIHGARMITLLARGELVPGSLCTIIPQSGNMGLKTTVKLEYEYTDSLGAVRRATMNTTDLYASPSRRTMIWLNGDEGKAIPLPNAQQLPEGGCEPIVYLPEKPDEVIALASCPGRLTLDDHGQLYGVSCGTVLVAMSPMLSILALFGGIAVLRFIA